MIVKLTTEKLPSPIYTIRSLSLFKETGIINLSGYDVWVSDMSRNVYFVKNKAFYSDGDKFVVMYTRTDSKADSRKFTINGSEIGSFTVSTYTIYINDLLSKGHAYIDDLGICVAFTRQDAEAYNVSSPVYQARHHQNTIEMFKTAMAMAPFKVMCNDPYCKLNELWTIINNQAYAVDITHLRDEPERCRIYLGFKPGNYSTTDIKFESLIKGEYAFDCAGTEVMLFPTREMAVKQIFKNKSNLAVFTMEDLNKRIKECKANLESDMDRYKRLNEELKNHNEMLQKEVIILRQQVTDYYNDQHRKNLHNEALERERYKTEKEYISYRSSSSNNWATIIKSAATVLPILISIFTILTTKKK